MRFAASERRSLMQRGQAHAQALLAHSDVDMTRVYLEDHEQPWTEVDVGLVLKR